MGMILSPEVKMARRIIQKHSLKIPFELKALVAKYAKIVYKPFPFEGIDGVCLNLKTPNKIPTVIVNSNSPNTRQNFTLAHELGHIIIPWHHGTIIDEILEKPDVPKTQYWELEREANKFASELLMPFDWILSLYKKNNNLKILHSRICTYCGVSERAAEIRIEIAVREIEYELMPNTLILKLYDAFDDLARVQNQLVETTKLPLKRIAEHMVQVIPKKIAYCIESNNEVIGCGGSHKSHSLFQWEGETFIKRPYHFYTKHSIFKSEKINTHWWTLDDKFNIPEDGRSWRELLEIIANDISPIQGTTKFKASINSKLSGAYGNWKNKTPNADINEFIEDSVRRFDNPEYLSFIKHEDFLPFIKNRCEALYKGK